MSCSVTHSFCVPPPPPPDACIIRWGLLWLRGRRSLEDRPLLLQTWPGGSHFHGNGELHNRAARWLWEGCTCPFLCQWTPECLFSHLSSGCCSLGWGLGSGNQKEKHSVGLSQTRHFMTVLRLWEGEEAVCTKADGKQLLLRLVEGRVCLTPAELHEDVFTLQFSPHSTSWWLTLVSLAFLCWRSPFFDGPTDKNLAQLWTASCLFP